MAVSEWAFPSSLKELVDCCAAFYKENKQKINSENIRKKRAGLCSFIEAFHKDCGTLTPGVRRRISDLRDGNCVFLMTAHQPNLFAYSGVLRKATLSFVLAKRLQERLEVPVVSFFGIADQDFTDDRWVRTAELPAVKRKGGVLTLGVEFAEKMMLNKVPRPSKDLMDCWKLSVENWLNDAINSVDSFCKGHDLPRLGSERLVLHRNFESFWKLVEDAYEHSMRYSDFNAFLMSKIINDVWRYDTLFSRFSECQQVLASEFAFLLSRFADYSRALKDVIGRHAEMEVGGGVSSQEPELAPFWYHCDCGSKLRLFLKEQEGSLVGCGDCVGCKRSFKLGFGAADCPDVAGVASRISARAIPMTLVFFKGLGVSCYVGGVGGKEYLVQARFVADKLGIALPPTAVWRPHDTYAGIGQLEALLELKRMCADLGVGDLSGAVDVLKSRLAEAQRCLDKLEASKGGIMEELRGHPEDEKLKEEIKRISLSQTEVKRSSNLSVINHELKILENIPVVLNLIPSIIDYAVNVGLKETSDQWTRYLNENGDLSSDVNLKSALNQVMRIRQ